MENQQVAVRTRNGDDLGVMTIDQFADLLAKDVANYSRPVTNN
jgi:threonyl-tRNA synthetase